MECNGDDCISHSSFFVTFCFLSMTEDVVLIITPCNRRTRARFHNVNICMDCLLGFAFLGLFPSNQRLTETVIR